MPGLSVHLYTLRLAPEGRVVQRRAHRKGKDKALPSQQTYLQVGRSFGTTYASLAAAWKAHAGGRYHARLKDAVVAYLRRRRFDLRMHFARTDLVAEKKASTQLA